MTFPSINNYIETIVSPTGRFKAIKDIVPERRRYEYPVFHDNGNTVDFAVRINGKNRTIIRYALKNERLNNPRNILLCQFLKENKYDFLASQSVLANEMLVYSDSGTFDYYDIILCRLPEGQKLDNLIISSARRNDQEKLVTLFDSVKDLAIKLSNIIYFTHNNLKPSSIIITDDNKAVLTDYRYAEINCSDNSTDLYHLYLILAYILIIIDRPDYIESTAQIINRWESLAKFIAGKYGVSSGKELSTIIDNIIPKKNISSPVCTGKFHEMLCAAKYGKKYSYIDSNGKEAIPFIFESASDFEEGLAIVSHNGLYGVIDKSGDEIIPLSYEDICWSAINGYIYVLDEGKWRLYNRDGTPATRYVFDYISDYHNDLAIIKKGNRYGFIDRNCQIAIPAIYENVSVFDTAGHTKVLKDGNEFYIDKEGRRLFTESS